MHDERCVLQEWMFDLSLKQQTVVLTGLRGCDGSGKYASCKPFVKKLRSVVLKNASNLANTKFMYNEISDEDVETMEWDEYPMHFVSHLMHAVEIVGYHHPDPEIQGWFYRLYLSMVDKFHLYPETKAQCDHRLRDGVESP